MAYVLSTNIVSPLGFTTGENVMALYEGRSSLRRYDGLWRLPEAFVASLFTEEQRAALQRDGYTLFESICIESARRALSETDFDIGASNVLLILSSTKANAPDGLGSPTYRHPGEAAQRIAEALGITTTPIVVCNACISGVNAQILAERMLRGGEYEYAIVVGADVQSDFIVSGFQSLKSVSTQPCRPFDIERNGLNLGECAATMIISASRQGQWSIVSGAIRNDAIHITNPSPQGEGCMQAINESLSLGHGQRDSLACINVHGTATMYNDQMESKAVQRAGLGEIPAFGIKGYYGHTMGAAGVLETIITLHAVGLGRIPATRGYAERGVSGRINISGTEQSVCGDSFLKIISGFGGCNAAVLYTMQARDSRLDQPISDYQIVNRVTLSSLDGQSLTALYRRLALNYPKFFKMDGLSKLAFVASEMLGEDFDAVTLFNRTSSVASDIRHAGLIADRAEFYPSPSVFIYTLPNIATGEIAIRRAKHGETSFYILPGKNTQVMHQVVKATFADPSIDRLLTGWVDFQDETHWEADIFIAQRNNN